MKPMLHASSAVSEVVGYVLMLALITITASIVLVIGMPNITNSQQRVNLQNVEQAFTVLDSKLSTCALGESPSRVMDLDLAGGRISILNDTSYSRLTIKMRKSGGEYMIYNNTIGTIRYELGDEEVGYEGGGVWHRCAHGGSLLISPPEFHYNGETLTLPIVKLNGSSAIASGKVTLQANSQNKPTVFYQNTTINPLFRNPVYDSTIIVKIKSRYYDAWARYFEERTEFHGVVKHDNLSEAVAYLNSRPSEQSDFYIPFDILGCNITNTTPVMSFKFELVNSTSNLELNLIATKESGETLEIDIQKSGGDGTRGGTVVIRYSNGSKSEEWKSPTGSDVIPMIISGNATVDLMNASTNVSYISSDHSWTWTSDPLYPNTYKNSGPDGPLPIAAVIQHYYRLMGPTFTWDYGAKNQGFTPEGSKIYHLYDTMPPRITFLHIVEHKVEVKLT
ncbi:MAG: type IV pilin N-terminal domain-containing protein [Halobacteria archaeon]